MKKDIETLIAEERADIILKYATVSLCLQHTENCVSGYDLVQMDHVSLCVLFLCSYQRTYVSDFVVAAFSKKIQMFIFNIDQ